MMGVESTSRLSSGRLAKVLELCEAPAQWMTKTNGAVGCWKVSHMA